MTGRSMLVVWASALSLTLAVAVAVLDFVDRRPYQRGSGPPSVDVDLSGTEIVVIGSSFTHRALPMDPVHGGLLGDGRSHRLLVSPGQTEAQSLYLLQLAIASGAETVLLEANDFLFDVIDPQPSLVRSPHDWIGAFFRSVVLGLQSERRYRSHPGGLALWTSDTIDLYDKVARNRIHDEPAVRLAFRMDAGREFSNLVAHARAHGVEVVLFLPPISERFENVLIGATNKAISDHAKAFAGTTGLPLWYAAEAWPDDYFADLRHANRQGRTRFLAEFAAWYANLR